MFVQFSSNGLSKLRRNRVTNLSGDLSSASLEGEFIRKGLKASGLTMSDWPIR
jgi:hypothetical protein